MIQPPDHFVRRDGPCFELGRVSLKEYPLRLFWVRADVNGRMMWAIGQNWNGYENRDVWPGQKQWWILQARVSEILAPHLERKNGDA